MAKRYAKILIVEDEPDLCEYYQDLLATIEISATVLKNCAAEAIESLDNDQELTGVICDYSMPGGSGASVLKHNLSHRRLPFCLISGGHPENLPELSGIQFNRDSTIFVQKPIDEEILLGHVKRTMVQIRES